MGVGDAVHFAGHQPGDRPLRFDQPAHRLAHRGVSDGDGGQLDDLGGLLAVTFDVDHDQALPGQRRMGRHGASSRTAGAGVAGWVQPISARPWRR
jgi:hypothetical protein